MNKTVLFICAVCFACPATDIGLSVHDDTLANGLRVIVVRDTTVAVVSCRLYYFVGSMYEGPGTTGLSHMYEHMMFKGTRRIGTSDYKKELPYMGKIDSIDAVIQRKRRGGTADGDAGLTLLRKQISALLDSQRVYIRKDELWDIYLNNGGTNLNAWTGDDMTAYIVTLPKNKIELFYWLEADRMANPVLREFNSERDVVMDERHMRYENRPLNRYFEQLLSRFYIAHPYRQPTIGWESDIRAYTRAKMEAHVKKFYTPDNALIVLNGNVDPGKALADIRRYVGKIKRAAVPKEEVVTREPVPAGQTRFTVYDQAEQRIDILFHTPGYPDEALYKLEVLEGVMNGKSGTLYKRLVLEEKLCTNAGSANSIQLQEGDFHVFATLKEGSDPARVEAVLLEEIRALATRAPDEREITRIKNSIRMDFTTRLRSLEGLSDQLAWFERLGSWRDINTYPAKVAAVSPESVPAAVRTWLAPERATIGLLLRKQSEPATQPVSQEEAE